MRDWHCIPIEPGMPPSETFAGMWARASEETVTTSAGVPCPWFEQPDFAARVVGAARSCILKTNAFAPGSTLVYDVYPIDLEKLLDADAAVRRFYAQQETNPCGLSTLIFT